MSIPPPQKKLEIPGGGGGGGYLKGQTKCLKLNCNFQSVGGGGGGVLRKSSLLYSMSLNVAVTH